jgi:CheY-like chemotaxis protein
MRTLVIDGHAETADLFSLLLEHDGHESYSCIDPLEGLKTAARVRPDIVLLGASYYKMDGYRLATQLRNLDGMSKLRLVMLSGHAPDLERMQNCGIERHFNKPINVPAVLQQINAVPVAVTSKPYLAVQAKRATARSKRVSPDSGTGARIKPR